MKSSYIFLPILFSILIFPAYAEHILPPEVTDVYATIEYQIIGLEPNERVQVDIEFFDHESNHLDLSVDYNLWIVQVNGDHADNDLPRIIYYEPVAELKVSQGAKATHITETLFHNVNGQHAIWIELEILGIGDLLPYPIEFEDIEPNPLIYSLVRPNENPHERDFRP